jgi:hypothetical protein
MICSVWRFFVFTKCVGCLDLMILLGNLNHLKGIESFYELKWLGKNSIENVSQSSKISNQCRETNLCNSGRRYLMWCVVRVVGDQHQCKNVATCFSLLLPVSDLPVLLASHPDRRKWAVPCLSERLSRKPSWLQTTFTGRGCQVKSR